MVKKQKKEKYFMLLGSRLCVSQNTNRENGFCVRKNKRNKAKVVSVLFMTRKVYGNSKH